MLVGFKYNNSCVPVLLVGVILLVPPVCCNAVGGKPLVIVVVLATVRVTGTSTKTVFCGHEQVGEAVLDCVVVLVVVVVVVGVVVIVLVVVEVD